MFYKNLIFVLLVTLVTLVTLSYFLTFYKNDNKNSFHFRNLCLEAKFHMEYEHHQSNHLYFLIYKYFLSIPNETKYFLSFQNPYVPNDGYKNSTYQYFLSYNGFGNIVFPI